MGADSTLYTASLNYGKSLAGAEFPDTSAQSKAQVDITRTYLKGIGDVFKNLKAEREATEIAQNIQLKEFKKAAKEAKAHLLEEEQAQPIKVHNAIYDKFKALENDFLLVNTTGEDDNAENEKKRASLYAQLQAITNQAIKSRAAIAKYGTMGDDLIITGNIKENIEVSRAIMDVVGDYEHVELFFNKDSQLTYLVQLPGMDEAVEWTIDDFEKNTHFHNIEMDAYSAKRELFQLKNGGESKDGIWEEKDQKSEKSTFIKTNIGGEDKKFINVAFSEINGRKSWVNSLYDGEGSYDIALAAVKHLFVEGEQNNIAGLVDVDGVGGITFADMDRNGDEKITEADLMQLLPKELEAWQMNIKSIIGALTDPGHDGFNLDRSSDALGDYFIDGLGEHFNDGFRDRPDPKTDLTQTQIENINRRNAINELVKKDPATITMNDINKITRRSDIEIVKDGGKYKIYQTTTTKKTKIKEFPVTDMETLRIELYNYANVDQTYRDFSKLPEYEMQETQYPGITKIGYTGEGKYDK